MVHACRACDSGGSRLPGAVLGGFADFMELGDHERPFIAAAHKVTAMHRLVGRTVKGHQLPGSSEGATASRAFAAEFLKQRSEAARGFFDQVRERHEIVGLDEPSSRAGVVGSPTIQAL